MTVMGPYNSPMALGLRPWGCLFFSFWAVFVISVGVQGFLELVAPEYMGAVLAGETAEALQARWAVILFGYVATLFLTMRWAEYVGAGAFAASMKTDQLWIMIALAGGPMIIILGNLLAAMIFAGGDPNWHLQEGVDTAVLSKEATSGISFIFAVVIAAPILEEVAYRGVGLGCMLARGWSPWLAGGIITLMFTLSHTHLSPPALIPIFTAGVFLAWLRIRSGSLAPSIAAHIAANTSVLFL